MSQILKKLSETENSEGSPAAKLAIVPEDIFDTVESEAEIIAGKKRTLFNRVGVSILVFALISTGAVKWIRRGHSIPIVDFTKLLQSQVVDLNRQAIESFYAGNYDLASRLLQQAENLDPKNTSSLINRAIVFRHQNNPEEAVAEFDKVLKLEPTNSAALNGLGRISLDAGSIEEAEAFFKRAMSSNPVASEALLNLGEIEEQRENWLIAAGYYESYLHNPSADEALKLMVSRRSKNIVAIAQAASSIATKAKE